MVVPFGAAPDSPARWRGGGKKVCREFIERFFPGSSGFRGGTCRNSGCPGGNRKWDRRGARTDAGTRSAGGTYLTFIMVEPSCFAISFRWSQDALHSLSSLPMFDASSSKSIFEALVTAPIWTICANDAEHAARGIISWSLVISFVWRAVENI